MLCTCMYLMLRLMQQEFCVPRLKTAIGTVIHNCRICTIYRKNLGQQIIAALPPERTTLTRPFTHRKNYFLKLNLILDVVAESLKDMCLCALLQKQFIWKQPMNYRRTVFWQYSLVFLPDEVAPHISIRIMKPRSLAQRI